MEVDEKAPWLRIVTYQQGTSTWPQEDAEELQNTESDFVRLRIGKFLSEFIAIDGPEFFDGLKPDLLRCLHASSVREAGTAPRRMVLPQEASTKQILIGFASRGRNAHLGRRPRIP